MNSVSRITNFLRSKAKYIVLIALVLGLVGSALFVQQRENYNNQIKQGQPRSWLTVGTEKNYLLSEPMNVIADQDNKRIYVADTGNGRIVVFDYKGQGLFSFGTRGSGNGQFLYPYGLLLTKQGTIWVSDPTNRSIQEFTLKGEFKKRVFYGSDGTRPGLMTQDKDGVFVSDLGRSQVVRLDWAGSEVNQNFTKDERIGHPQGLALDSKGRLWVVDEKTGDIRVFNPDGSPSAKYQVGVNIRGLAIDRFDRVWVSDSLAGKVKVLDNNGKDLFGLESRHPQPYPVGVYVSENNTVFIAERGTNLIKVWSYLAK